MAESAERKKKGKSHRCIKGLDLTKIDYQSASMHIVGERSASFCLL